MLALGYAIFTLLGKDQGYYRYRTAGGVVWLEGATADPDDESARQTAYRIACA